MPKRFVTIWFRSLRTDWFTVREPGLKMVPFVLVSKEHGRMMITAANALARNEGIETGMALADARAVVPGLQVKDDSQEMSGKLLKGIAGWFIRFTPKAAFSLPEDIMLDVTGCAHLWGGEAGYLKTIIRRLNAFGYSVKTGMADTPGAAWAVAHFDSPLISPIVNSGDQYHRLMSLSPASLRLEQELNERFLKLGLFRIADLAAINRAALRRRFGDALILRMDQAFGREEEMIFPVEPVEPYRERLPCMEPIGTATGIFIALERLIASMQERLQKEQKGVRQLSFRCLRIDDKMVEAAIGTHRPSRNPAHLLKLFEPKLSQLEPGPGIELFVLESSVVEDLTSSQEKLWEASGGLEDSGLAELLDRLANSIGTDRIHRYLPAQHYWPERSVQSARSLTEKPATGWWQETPRPVQLLSRPEAIEVTAPVPDYPPMLFRYKGELHKVHKADGPERIEQEWWLQEGQHRDYYVVEDEEGRRYWLFRSGHYSAEKTFQWFLHGFFA